MFWNSGKKTKKEDDSKEATSKPAKKTTLFEDRKKSAESSLREINERLGILSEEERSAIKEEQEFYARDHKMAVALNRGGLAESKPIPVSAQQKSEPAAPNNETNTSKEKQGKLSVPPALRRPF